MKTLLGILAASTLAASLAGCDTHEKFTYSSTPAVPQTVSLRNTTTGEELWSYDVPPGQQLQLWFANSRTRANQQGFDEMVWVVGPTGAGVPPQQNRMRVPPPNSRRLEGSVRPAEPMPVASSPTPGLTSPDTK